MKNTFINKTDLAIAYFPYVNEHTARHKLMALINDDHDLMQSLIACGYRTLSRAFSPKQLELIYERIGNPFK